MLREEKVGIRLKGEKGFTLMEILVAIAILFACPVGMVPGK